VEAHVKQRITGAIVLVVLIVIFVPALLSGPRRPASSSSGPAAQPLQNDRPDVHAEAPAPAQPGTTSSSSNSPDAGQPASPRANANDAVAPVIAGRDQENTPDPAPRAKPLSVVKPVEVSKRPASPALAEAPRRAPAPSSAATPPAKPPSSPARLAGAWAVQLGGFSSRPNAQKLVEQLKGQGFTAYVAEAGSGGHTLFRVRAGPVRDRNAAEALLKRLKGKGHSGSLVTNP
jgi:DedD protein